MTASEAVGAALSPLRRLFAWALLGYVALHLLLQMAALAARATSGGPLRDVSAVGVSFADPYHAGLVFGAVLIAMLPRPLPTEAVRIARGALAAYAVMIFFGAISLLAGIVQMYAIQGRGLMPFGYQTTMNSGFAAGSLADLMLTTIVAVAALKVYRAVGRTPSQAAQSQAAQWSDGSAAEGSRP